MRRKGRKSRNLGGFLHNEFSEMSKQRGTVRLCTLELFASLAQLRAGSDERHNPARTYSDLLTARLFPRGVQRKPVLPRHFEAHVYTNTASESFMAPSQGCCNSVKGPRVAGKECLVLLEFPELFATALKPTGCHFVPLPCYVTHPIRGG